MNFIRTILIPIGVVYATAVKIHQQLHKRGFLAQKKFRFPIINVGNLSVGGTGKSPHVEYIHRLLSFHYDKMAIISRGYRRQTKGLQILTTKSTALDVGDEPLQFKYKFPKTTVVVSEKRAPAIDYIIQSEHPADCILLDDAFQHWAVQVPINILLSTFDAPFFDDKPLPAGRLREFPKGYQRAQIIIITKCPQQLSSNQKETYIKKIKPLPSQEVFFSHFAYQALYLFNAPSQAINLGIIKDKTICLFTAIASTQYLHLFLESQGCIIKQISFPDHHHFSEENLELLIKQDADTIIITTEKDATKLQQHQLFIEQHQLKIYVLPIQVAFDNREAQRFEATLLNLLEAIK